MDPDFALRQVAVARARELTEIYDDHVPVTAIRDGFWYDGKLIKFGSMQKGIHRSRHQRGPAALTLMTSFKDPYDDVVDAESGAFTYGYRDGPVDQPDNRALRAAYELRAPIVYFKGVAPSVYLVVAPMFVTADDSVARTVTLESGLPIDDMGPQGPQSDQGLRAYATRETRVRLHQARFKVAVMRAYGNRCAVCALEEPALVQAAHIVPDSEPGGMPAVVNGLALCVMHHLAYDRNLLGINADGIVHVTPRLLHTATNTMMRNSLHAFDRETIARPRRVADRPDPERLDWRFAQFEQAAA